MKHILSRIDSQLLFSLSLVFLVLIPLYPKFPLLPIDYTYISIRLEDLFMVIWTGLFAIQLARKKVVFDKQLTLLIAAYWAVVFISFAVNAWVTGHVIYKQVGILHTLRRVEYMIPFFIFYSLVRQRIQNTHHFEQKIVAVRPFLHTISVVLLLVCLYALGQKTSLLFEPVRAFFNNISSTNIPVVSNVAYVLFRFFDFPAVQTMNSEFAKGSLLNLTPESRVSSTFAGHYDLAAYLVLFLPLLASLLLRNINKIRNSITYVSAILVLVLTASRASFAAFIASMTLYFVSMRKWRALAITVVITGVLMFANRDLTGRFMDMFQKKRVFENVKTGAVIINQDITSKELPAGSEFVKESPAQVVMTVQDKKDLTQQLVKHEVEEAKKQGKQLTEAEARAIVSTKYKELQNFVVKDVVAGDTSLATRTQVEWPRAINAFLTNPLLGTGPSSITESTDGDYFRWIGETGALGAGLFIAILALLLKRSYIAAKGKTLGERSLYLAFVGGILALGANAVLIDVFEASKVAFIFWAYAGIMTALVAHSSKKA